MSLQRGTLVAFSSNKKRNVMDSIGWVAFPLQGDDFSITVLFSDLIGEKQVMRTEAECVSLAQFTSPPRFSREAWEVIVRLANKIRMDREALVAFGARIARSQ